MPPPPGKPVTFYECHPEDHAPAPSVRADFCGLTMIIYYDYHGLLGKSCTYMGVSENSVPLNPMVLLIIIPIKWLFHWEYTLFSDKPICQDENHCFRCLKESPISGCGAKKSTDTKMWYLSDAEAFLAWDWPLGENGFG